MINAEQIRTRETRASVEDPPMSRALRLRIAKGIFTPPDVNTPLDTQLPQKVHPNALTALKNENVATRKKDEETFHKNAQNPSEARHAHMFYWALHAGEELSLDLQRAERGGTTARILQDKLHLNVPDDRTNANALSAQLYMPQNRAGGVFYQWFCSGNMPAKLANALATDEIKHMKTFLIRWMLGSEEAYNALLALRETMDDVAIRDGRQNELFAREGNAPLAPKDAQILAFYRQWLGEAQQSTPTAKPITPVAPPLFTSPPGTPMPQQSPQQLAAATRQPPQPMPKAPVPISVQEPQRPQPTSVPALTRQPEMPTQTSVNSFIATEPHPPHPGRNEDNEDTSFVNARRGMGGIFDGAGGSSAGEIASRAAQKTMEKVLASLPDNATEREAQDTIRQAFEQANEAVTQTKASTTAAVFTILGDKQKSLLVGNIGDSRVWVRQQNGTLVQVTRDGNMLRGKYHRDMQRANEQNKQTIEHAYNELDLTLSNATRLEDIPDNALPYWNTRNLTTLLGYPDSLDHLEFFQAPITDGDIVLMTTDGIHDNLTNKQIAAIAKKFTDPKTLTKELIASAQKVAKTQKIDDKGNNLGDLRSKKDDMTAAALVVGPIEKQLQRRTTSSPQSPQSPFAVTRNPEATIDKQPTSMTFAQRLRKPIDEIPENERSFQEEDIARLRLLVTQATNNLLARPGFTELLQTLQKNQAVKTTEYATALTYGHVLIPNPSLTQPQVTKDGDNIIQIEVPPHLYRAWQAYMDADFVKRVLNEYESRLQQANNTIWHAGVFLANAIETLQEYR